MKTPTLVTRVFFPTRLLHEIQGGYMIGWNINDFTACVMCLIGPEEYTYKELTTVLEKILCDDTTTNLREYCGGSPVVLGYLEQKNSQKFQIWKCKNKQIVYGLPCRWSYLRH